MRPALLTAYARRICARRALCNASAMHGRTDVLTENASQSKGKFFRYLTRALAYADFDGLGWLRFARRGSA